MTCIYHNFTPDKSNQELPVQITNTFPPKGVVANILNNSTGTKGDSLHFYGHFNAPLSIHSGWPLHKAKYQHIAMKTQKDGFSPPPTITEIKSLTRKTPRFYTIDTSILTHGRADILPVVNKLIANSDLTGLKEVYQKICKGSMKSLESLISKRQVSQKFAFVHTSSPLRYKYQERGYSYKEKEQQGFAAQDPEIKTQRKEDKLRQQKVLVPSPYFRRDQNQNSKKDASEVPSPAEIFYSKTKAGRQNGNKKDRRPIEPTVINLNNKLPDLCANQRYCACAQINETCGANSYGREGTNSILAKPGTAMSNAQAQVVGKDHGLRPGGLQTNKSENVLYGRTMKRNGRTSTKRHSRCETENS